MLNVIVLNVIMLRIIMLSVIFMSLIMLVVKWDKINENNLKVLGSIPSRDKIEKKVSVCCVLLC